MQTKNCPHPGNEPEVQTPIISIQKPLKEMETNSLSLRERKRIGAKSERKEMARKIRKFRPQKDGRATTFRRVSKSDDEICS